MNIGEKDIFRPVTITFDEQDEYQDFIDLVELCVSHLVDIGEGKSSTWSLGREILRLDAGK